MTEEKKAECVLRLFGVPDAAVKEAAGGFSPQWKAEARWKSRGAETLVALSAQNPAGLKKAAQVLREKFCRLLRVPTVRKFVKPLKNFLQAVLQLVERAFSLLIK